MIEDVVEALIRYRKEKQITQAEVALKINVNQSRVSAIEKNEHEMLVSSLKKYAAALGAEVHVHVAVSGSDKDYLLQLIDGLTDDELSAILATVDTRPHQLPLLPSL